MFSQIASIAQRASLYSILLKSRKQIIANVPLGNQTLIKNFSGFSVPNNKIVKDYPKETSSQGVADQFKVALSGLENFFNQELTNATDEMGEKVSSENKRLTDEITEISKKIKEETAVSLTEKASSLQAQFASAGTKIQILKEESEQLKSSADKSKKMLGILTGTLGTMIIFGFFNHQKTQKEIEDAKKEMKKDLSNNIEESLKKVHRTGQVDVLSRELRDKLFLVEQYNEKLKEYWPRPWPSHRSLYQEKIKDCQSTVDRLHNEILILNPKFDIESLKSEVRVLMPKNKVAP